MYHRVRPHVPLIGRFIFSGSLAAAANIGTFSVLVHVFNLWYLAATPIAFIAGFIVSFTMQKYWTFKDQEKRVARQAALYFVIVFVNLLLNTAIVYVLVEYIHMWSVLAQATASVAIAFESFFVYRLLVFSTPSHATQTLDNHSSL